MKLEFRLLVVDDTVGSVQAAINLLGMHLSQRGFALEPKYAEDLTPAGLRELTRQQGKNFDLVIIDFNLGLEHSDGADAAFMLRKELQYTDIIFFSSVGGADLLAQLAAKEVAGVFVASRLNIADSMIGIADTIIGKAIDLTHMRGIAMARVAEMDLLMEETLMETFSKAAEVFPGQTKRILAEVLDSSARIRAKIEPLVESGDIVSIISNGSLFSSFQKYQAVRSLAKLLPVLPSALLNTLKNYSSDIIDKRNALAHAKELFDEKTETTTLRSIRAGGEPIIIDDQWMRDFRGTLSSHHGALIQICALLAGHCEMQSQLNTAVENTL